MQRRQLFQLAGAAALTTAFSTFSKKVEATGISMPQGISLPIKLNFNENSLGMSAKAKKAISDSLDIGFRYPDDQREELIGLIAKKFNLATNQISMGNGSSENIQAIVQALIIRAQKNNTPIQLVVPDPTFNYAELYAQALGISVVKVPLLADFSFDIKQLQQAAEQFKGETIFYLCNPNNPTAMITPATTLFDWINTAPAHHFFILDEAYAELVQNPDFKSGIELIKANKNNVAVTRTFSKLYGLAGYRIGYLLGTEEVVALAESCMSYDNTNLAGAVAAIASLQDPQFEQLSLANINASRQMVQKALTELGLKYVDSNANFIFHQIKGDVKTYQQRMKEHQIYVGREFLPIQGWNRLTLGTPQEMEVFVKTLKMFREKGWV
ncbi:pyridoxal phosphate-dependent aminotransferase [Ursidibacter sp. B-7004-1]